MTLTALLHERWRSRVALLAAGDPTDREATLAHVAGCDACRDELAELRQALLLLEHDPARVAEPRLALSALATRVHARLDERPRQRVSLWALAAAASVAVALLVPRQRPALLVPPEPVAMTASVPDELMARMERQLTRQHAARYLNEAQAVLIGVAATAPPCPDRKEHVDLAEESRRSRALLARRSLLLEIDDNALASARPVLEDVEQMLRAVASLEACTRTRDLRLIHDEMAQRRLLMKIDLMTRELQG